MSEEALHHLGICLTAVMAGATAIAAITAVVVARMTLRSMCMMRRPHLWIDIVPDEKLPALYVVIRNTGMTDAYNIRIESMPEIKFPLGNGKYYGEGLARLVDGAHIPPSGEIKTGLCFTRVFDEEYGGKVFEGCITYDGAYDKGLETKFKFRPSIERIRFQGKET